MISSTDTDFDVLCGDTCLLLNCTFPCRRNKLSDSLKDILLSSPSRNTIQKALNAISKPNIAIADATYPLFETRDPWWRALVAVAIRCDQCVGGVPGSINTIGISKWLEATDNPDPALFLNWLVADKRGKTRCPYSVEDLVVFAQAIYFEPGNVTEDSDVMEDRTFRYLHRKPNEGELDAYCGAFAESEELLSQASRDAHTCDGMGPTSPHSCLKSEVVFCEDCGKECCCFCVLPSEIDGKTMVCLSCLATILLLF